MKKQSAIRRWAQLATQVLLESSDTPGEDQEHKEVQAILLFITILFVYVTVGSFMEKKQFKFGHETGAIILIGFAASFTINYLGLIDIKFFEFNKSLFFEVFLPLIIFATAFNMRRKKFFQNIGNVAKFGVVGTFFTFVAYSALTYAFFKLFGDDLVATYIFDDKKDDVTFNLELIPVMYISSIFCSSDIIAAVTLIKFED